MRLGISADAAPGATPAELAETCARRGFGVVELTLPSGGDTGALLAQIDAAEFGTVRLAGIVSPCTGYANRLALLSRDAGVPIIVADTSGLAARITFTRSIVAHGGAALLLVRGPAHEWLHAVLDAGVRFAWQVDDDCTDPALDAAMILQRAGRIEYVRLLGSGPEATMHEGRGYGALITKLTLTGYDGPLVLAPSSTRYHVIWSTWLGRRGSWGCGTAAERADRSLNIQLQVQ